MKINIELDKALEETEVLIRAAKMTEEVNGILKKLEEPSVQMISGFAGDTLEILEQADIIRVYAAKGKVYAGTAKGEYLLRMRLYELTSRADMWQRSSGCWEYEKGNGERYEKESVTERTVRNSNRDCDRLCDHGHDVGILGRRQLLSVCARVCGRDGE